jgi:glycerate dehydrogenase
MKVLVHTRTKRELSESSGIEFCTLEELLTRSDVVSLHCQLTPETHGIINAKTLALMKSTSFILNAGRGALIDETALAAALNAKRIAGAGLDVLSAEPPDAQNPLVRARNCIITPHNGWATRTTRERLIATIIENLESFAKGKPVNVVSL